VADFAATKVIQAGGGDPGHRSSSPIRVAEVACSEVQAA